MIINHVIHQIDRALDSQWLKFVHRIFLTLVCSYGVLLITFGLPFYLHGQPSHDELERRVRVLEDQNLEHRVTVMETILQELQNNALWTRLNMGGTGLLIAEAVTRTLRGKRGGREFKPNLTITGE